MSFNQDVYDFVVANLDDPFAIAAAMAEFGVSSSQLAEAIGLDTAAVNSYFDNAGIAIADDTGAGFVDTGPVDTGPADTEPVSTAPIYPPGYEQEQLIQQQIRDEAAASAAQQQAGQSQVGQQATQQATQTQPTYDDNYTPSPYDTNEPPLQLNERGDVIRPTPEPIVTTPTPPVEEPKEEENYAIVGGSTGENPIENYYNALAMINGRLPVSLAYDINKDGKVTSEDAMMLGQGAPLVTGVTDPATQQPASTTTTTQPQFTGELRFDPTIGDGGGYVFITPEQQQAEYEAEQNRIAALTPVQRAVESAAYQQTGEQGDTTAYNDITIDGKTYSVLDPTTIVRKSDDQSGLTGNMTRYEYLSPETGDVTIDVQVDGGALQAVMPLLVTIGTAAFPGLAQVVGTALGATGATATAIGGAVINAAASVAAGADPKTAITNAAIGAGIGQLTNGLTGNSLVDNAIRSGATAAATGGDIGNAVLNSVIATGAQQTLGNASISGDVALDSGLVSAATSVVQALATGGDVTQSAIQGFVSGSTAAISKGEVASEVPGTTTSIAGGAGVDSVTGGGGAESVTGGGGADTTPASVGTDTVGGGSNWTVDVGMDTTPSVIQDDVIGIVAQEQEANKAQSTDQAMQGAQQITTADAQARELYPLTERYLGPNGTVYLRDINTGKITQVLPQGDISQVTGGGVFLDTPKVIGAVEALPATAIYQGILYAGDPKLIGKQLTADDLSSLSMSSGRDPNVLPVGNLVVTQNADGTVTQRDKVTGDTVTYGADNKIISQTKSLYTRLNDTANAVTGTGQSALGELGAAISAAGQQVGFDTQGLVENFQAMQAAGERMRPEVVNQQSKAFVDEIYQVSSRPGVTAQEVVGAIVSAAKNNPAGAVAIIGSELVQELPQLLLPGRLAGFLGSMALNAAESAGAQALQKIDELKVTNPNATPQELARMARQDAGIAGAVTAAIGLIPGANNVVARTLLEPVNEALEEGLIEYLTSGDINAAKGKAVLGAVIGGKTAAAINTGEELAAAVQNNLGVQVPGGVAAPSDSSLTVSGTRLPTDLTGINVDPEVDLTPDSIGTLPTTGVDIPTFNVADDTNADQNTGVVVAVDPDSNQASVIDNTGSLTIVPANGLTPGQTTVVPVVSGTPSSAITGATGATSGQVTGPTVTTGTGDTSLDTSGSLSNGQGGATGAVDVIGGGSSVGGGGSVGGGEGGGGVTITPGSGVTVDTSNNVVTATGPATSVGTGAITTSGGGTSGEIGPGAVVDVGGNTGSGTVTGAQTTTPTGTVTQDTSTTEVTGVVLQDNGDGTSLVLTQDGGATNVSSVDTATGGTLAPGSSVTVDTSNNTATATGTGVSTATGAETGTGVDTSTATGATTGTSTATGTDTSTATGTETTQDTSTGTATDTATNTATQTQPETVTQTQPETVTQTQPEPEVVTEPNVNPNPNPNPNVNPNINTQINTEEPEPTQPEPPPVEPPAVELTPEDQLLQQIILELEKPTIPDTPPPPPIEPPLFTPPDSIVETPPVSVDRPLTIRPRTVRPTVMPGSRVQDTASLLPVRPGLSEGYQGDIEGTPEEEQQPVWNVRSLKLRRLLGI
jgi:hypothetical protein